MIGIYKITSPSGKVYIGQTTNFIKRKNYYKNGAKPYQIRIYNSLNKYGYDAHTIEFIEECLVENLNERERYFQDFYNVIGENGLNCRLTATDDKSGFLSESSKHKLSIAKKKVVIDGEWREKFAYDWSGKNHSEETRRKMSESAKGKKKSAEHIAKLPQNQKGYKSKQRSQEFKLNQKLFNGKSKIVYQYDKNDILINQFISAAEAKRQTGIKTINSVVLGKTKTAGGFKWRYDKL
jgi:group I intron endonuclease